MPIPTSERYTFHKQQLFQLANDEDHSVLDTSESFRLPAIKIVFSQTGQKLRVEVFNAWEIKNEIEVLSDDSTYDTNTKARVLQYPIDQTNTPETITDEFKKAIHELVELFGCPRNCTFEMN